jgi:N-acetylneuraminic acid mutarotase
MTPFLSSGRVRHLVVFVALLITVSAASAQKGHWTKGAPFPDPSQEIGGTAVDKRIVILGGLIDGQIPKAMVWQYDSVTDKWTKMKDMPRAGHHLATAAYKGKLYVFGGGAQLRPGGDTWVPVNSAWEYDLDKDSWRALAPMPTRRGAAVAAVVGDKIYVIGGAGYHPNEKRIDFGLSANVPHRALTTNEVYDPATDKWETRSPMPTARNHASIGVANGKIYVIGGRLGSVFVNASATDVVEEYDPASDSWGYAMARMPRPRTGTAFGSYNGKIYIAGGEYLDNNIVGTYRDVDVFDPIANAWTSLPPLSVPRHGLIGGMIGNHFHVISGHMQSGAAGGVAMDSELNDIFEITEP